MKKIRIEFQDENSTEFNVNVQGVLTYRELLVLARGLPNHSDAGVRLHKSERPIIEVQIPGSYGEIFGMIVKGSVMEWQIQLVADEFLLAAQHIFFTQQNQAMVRAARNQQAIAALQRGNSGLIIPGGRG